MPSNNNNKKQIYKSKPSLSSPNKISTKLEQAKLKEAVRMNRERMQRQKEAFQSAINGEPVADSLNILTAIVKKELGNDVRTSFYLAYPDGASLHAIEGAGDMPESYTSPVDGFPVGKDSFACGLAIATGRPIVTRDVFEEPMWQPYVHLATQHNFRSCGSYPILTREGNPMGTFAMYFTKVRDATSQDLAVADAVTQAAAIIISRDAEAHERAQAEAALRKSENLLAEELTDIITLQKLSSAIIQEGDLTVLYNALVDSAMDIMHSDCASIQILLPEKNQLLLTSSKGFHPYSADFWRCVNASSASTCGQALLKGRRIIVTDVSDPAFEVTGDLHYYRVSGIVAVQSTPLISRSGKQVGMMSTHWKHVHQPSQRDLNLFDVLARQTADLIERTQAEEALHKSTIELRESREDLFEKNRQLQQTIAQLESFNYLASHDLQEPLRKIQTFVELLNESKTDEAAQIQYTNKIRESSLRMAQLIDDLLQYSRLSRASDAFQSTDLNKILENVKADYEIAINEKQATIESENLPTISAVAFQMQQLFSNIIGNSLKFSERRPRIIISSRIVCGEGLISNGNGYSGNFVEIKFSDNGIGFDNQYSKKIFEIFQRLHPQSKFSGTGIGLSIVEKIVQHHKGFVKAEGEKNKGAVFTVYLPAN